MGKNLGILPVSSPFPSLGHNNTKVILIGREAISKSRQRRQPHPFVPKTNKNLRKIQWASFFRRKHTKSETIRGFNA